MVRLDKSLRQKKLIDFIEEVGVGIFAGDMPFVSGTPEHDAVSRVLKRFSFILRKVGQKLSKNGAEINLEKMLLDTIGNNKGFSDNNAEFILR